MTRLHLPAVADEEQKVKVYRKAMERDSFQSMLFQGMLDGPSELLRQHSHGLTKEKTEGEGEVGGRGGRAKGLV